MSLPPLSQVSHIVPDRVHCHTGKRRRSLHAKMKHITTRDQKWTCRRNDWCRLHAPLIHRFGPVVITAAKAQSSWVRFLPLYFPQTTFVPGKWGEMDLKFKICQIKANKNKPSVMILTRFPQEALHITSGTPTRPRHKPESFPRIVPSFPMKMKIINKQ